MFLVGMSDGNRYKVHGNEIHFKVVRYADFIFDVNSSDNTLKTLKYRWDIGDLSKLVECISSFANSPDISTTQLNVLYHNK